jgi:hypothetical protein
MKKGFFSCVAIVMLMVFLSASSVFAADEFTKNFISNKVGVGYQGMIVGNLLNGVSVRGWIGERIGLEGNFIMGSAKVRSTGSASAPIIGSVRDGEGDVWDLEAKAMYALIVRSNSKFYVGGKIGYGRVDIDGFPTQEFWTPGAFVGSEYSLPSIPEVGLNFEVGYSGIIYNSTSLPGTTVDLRLHGVNAALGIHYYF